MKAKNLINTFTMYLSVIVLLVVTPFYTLDPVNIPKITILVTFGCVGLLFIIFNYKYFNNQLTTHSKLFILFFSLTLLVSVLSSSAPIVQQIYGREGRNNGLLTYLSLLVLFIMSGELNSEKDKKRFTKIFVAAALIITVYGIFQSFGFDLFKWQTVNLKVFATLGNPNFLSAFLSIALVPTLLLLYFTKLINKKLMKYSLIIIYFLANIFLQYCTHSYQGVGITIVLIFLGIGILGISKNKKMIMIPSFTIIGSTFIILLLIITKIGYFAKFYKGSIGSRLDFFYSAYHMGKANWFTGVGLDSFGDYYLQYRSFSAANKSNAEYTDSSHNYFLDIFGNLGFIALLVYLIFTIFTLYYFILTLRKQKYESITVSLFLIWVGCQLQSLLSPTNLVFNVLIFAISGIMFRSAKYFSEGKDQIKFPKLKIVVPSFFIGITISLLIMTPLVKRDHAILVANNLRSADQLEIALDMFPKSTAGYQRSLLLIENAGLGNISYSVAKKASEFNPRSSAPWYILFTNLNSTEAEKNLAFQKLVSLDPNNMYVKKLR